MSWERDGILDWHGGRRWTVGILWMSRSPGVAHYRAYARSAYDCLELLSDKCIFTFARGASRPVQPAPL